MIVASFGWSVPRLAAALAAGPPGSANWEAAIGAPENAVLTADGGQAVLTERCRCREPSPVTARWQYWTADGCQEEGAVCGRCRRVTSGG